ncbi:The alpha-D-phosphohexomutase superfamily protein [Mycoplasmoides gallisepticum S6]|uniref:The alpha-D-phosphohexomutase superfamily protein n=2 Tax=Mycoplasmoides gallisepticum TaxID=2096 RepID=A0A0F6CL00_MYCGL|nr:The alpha-D-phosphohexomutase superfamily protein [Mycoplasmoides gallisepticum S6]
MTVNMSQEQTNIKSILYNKFGSIKITDKAFRSFIKNKIDTYLENNKVIELIKVDLYHFYDDTNAQINIYVKYLKKKYDNNLIKNLSKQVTNAINVELGLAITSVNFIQQF